MKCKNCGKKLRAEVAITEPGYIIFHECITTGDTETETINTFIHNQKKQSTDLQKAVELVRRCSCYLINEPIIKDIDQFLNEQGG